MNNPFSKFIIKLLVILALAFGVHILTLKILDFPLFDNKIILSYCVNVILAIAIFGFLYKMKEKYKEQLGFLFMAGSALKFAVFFIVFQPIYKLDGEVSRLEFLAFFAPYVLCLILETFSLSKLLNKLD